MDEKLGTIMIDGKIIDLDKTPLEELKKIKNKLENEEEEIRKEINKLLEI